jgi:hypothetical protein
MRIVFHEYIYKLVMHCLKILNHLVYSGNASVDWSFDHWLVLISQGFLCGPTSVSTWFGVKEFNLTASQIIIIIVTHHHHRAVSIWQFLFLFAWLLVIRSRHLVSHSGLLGNLNVLVFIRDLRVKNWLWLGKILAPLTHPTWGKLLRDLM